LTDITVSIVNTNGRELLLACLDSLQRSITRDVNVEIVVLDNASEDGSAGAVRERFPSVRVIAQQFRAGFPANHNTVIRATDGHYIFVLNEDTASDDWAFPRMVSEMDTHPRVAALGPKLVYPDGRHQASAWRFPTPAITLLGLPTLGQVGIEQSKGEGPRTVDWLMGAALFLRREALDEVGLFDESFFIYFEEVDLCLRLQRAGWETRYFPGVTVVHHESQFSADVPERRINEMWRGRHRYWRKHHTATGARIAAFATGGQYLGAAAAGFVRRDAAYRAGMRLHARNAWRVEGPGLRELAAEWNRRAGVEAAHSPPRR
jgi:N-acetylglucosaminyl-diphospho-decaprenol L-rhamnosyltransferase